MRVVFLIVCLFAAMPVYAAALLPLEIINIKPAGTGSPAIPATNRIFRAYPGIEYNIRAAVIGGVYPYTYSLSNAPSGMTINSRTGEIIWPNPQADSGTITISVTDSENTTVTSSWNVSVSTGGFVFVDAAYSGTSTGSYMQPFKSLPDVFAASTLTSDILYFREGSYQITVAAGANINLGNQEAPHTWIGYPGESVVVSGNSGAIYTYWCHFDNIYFQNFVNYGLFLRSNQNYTTIRRTVWDGLTTSDTTNNNYGFSFTYNEGTGYYLTFQDNEFKNYGGAAIGSLYYTNKTLIENNYIHSPSPQASGQFSMRPAIAVKEGNDNVTVRGNKVITAGSGAILGGADNTLLYGTDNLEVLYNLFVRSDGSNNEVHYFNQRGDSSEGTLRNMKYHRNTVMGYVRFGKLDNGYSPGPYTLEKNIIVNSNADKSGTYVSRNYLSFGVEIANPDYWRDWIEDTGNLFSLPASSPVGSDYKLLNSALVGTTGWQLADGTTPLEDGEPPSPIDGVCGSADGGTFSSPPSSNLCSSGTATAVSGPSPNYTWTCEGINGSEVDDSCSATYDAGATPTCSDGIQNGDETGVDCGGSCPECSSSGSTTTISAGTMPISVGTTPITVQ